MSQLGHTFAESPECAPEMRTVTTTDGRTVPLLMNAPTRIGRRPLPLLVVLTAGCIVGTSEPGVGQAFANKAVVVCKAARAQKTAEGPFPYPNFNPTKPDKSEFPGVAQYLMKTLNTYRTWLGQMQALGEPPSGKSYWDDLLRAIASHVELNVDQIAAAQAGDSQTFSNDYYKGAKTQDALLHAANDAGVPACAAVDR